MRMFKETRERVRKSFDDKKNKQIKTRQDRTGIGAVYIKNFAEIKQRGATPLYMNCKYLVWLETLRRASFELGKFL